MKPMITARVKPGKAYGAIRGLAETLNWVITFCERLKGDDNDIFVDRTDSDTPVIRLRRGYGGAGVYHFHFPALYTEVDDGGDDDDDGDDGGSGGDDGGSSGDNVVVAIGDGAIQVGGYTIFAGAGNIIGRTGDENYIVCARVKLSDMSFDGFYAYQDESGVNEAQNDMEYYIFPLYKIVEGAVDVDYRPLPNAGCWEDPQGSSEGESS